MPPPGWTEATTTARLNFPLIVLYYGQPFVGVDLRIDRAKFCYASFTSYLWYVYQRGDGAASGVRGGRPSPSRKAQSRQGLPGKRRPSPRQATVDFTTEVVEIGCRRAGVAWLRIQYEYTGIFPILVVLINSWQLCGKWQSPFPSMRVLKRQLSRAVTAAAASPVLRARLTVAHWYWRFILLGILVVHWQYY